MIPGERRRIPVALALRVLFGVARLLLLGPMTLVGCATLDGTPSEVRPAEQRWTPPPPSPSALYADLREEGALVPGERGRPGGLPEETFSRRMENLLGKEVLEVSPSPNGSWMVFIVPWREGGTSGEIWVCRTDGRWPYLLHAGLGSADRTVWRAEGSPEGRIYFRSRGRVWSFRPVLLDVEERTS